MGLVPRSGKTPGGGNGNLLQYSCLENPMDSGAWRATVHGVAKSHIRLNDSTHAHTHSYVTQYTKTLQTEALNKSKAYINVFSDIA